MKSRVSMVEYIWLDGAHPTQELRSKTRILAYSQNISLEDLPSWSFDGSSTNQASGDRSDCLLQPVFVSSDPVRGEGHYLVMCEVLNADKSPHRTNHRAHLRDLMEKGGADHDAYVGFEQEYTFFKHGRPLGWPQDGFPAPQGPFYCGVGVKNVFGRKIVEEHARACSDVGLCIFGTNAEVMPGQWEFQIGYRDIPGEAADPLTLSDHLWLARYLLHLIAEKYGVAVTFSNKPIKGDWNGSGMHANFSNTLLRTCGSKETYEKVCEAFRPVVKEHIEVYGVDNEQRLTGLHETASINDFSYGVSDRGASIRIPIITVEKGWKGWLEDRRPASNGDPYKIAGRIIKTVKSAE